MIVVILLLLIIMTNASIPFATEVVDFNIEIKNIKKTLEKIVNSVDKSNNVLSGFDIMIIKTSIYDLTYQINNLKTYTKNIETLNNLVAEYNILLKPISNLANNKIKASEIEATIKEKEFNLKIAEIKAKEKNISVWDAYMLENNDKNEKLSYVVFMLVLLLSSIIVIQQSKLSKL